MRHAPTPKDRLICAWLAGASCRHAKWRFPEGEEREAALAELRDIATLDGKLRADLLAQEARILLGVADVKGAPHGLQSAIQGTLLLEAGAGPAELVEAWRAEWQRRAGQPLPGLEPRWVRPVG